MEQFLTTTETAKHLKITRQTLAKWVKQKKIKSIKIGGVVRFKVSEIEKIK